MTAREVLDLWGGSLLGRQVVTPPMGSYPGGVSTVTEILPDPAAPEILFHIDHPTFGPCGVFDFEECEVIQ